MSISGQIDYHHIALVEALGSHPIEIFVSMVWEIAQCPYPWQLVLISVLL